MLKTSIREGSDYGIDGYEQPIAESLEASDICGFCEAVASQGFEI
jgi:hypothetical protein